MKIRNQKSEVRSRKKNLIILSVFCFLSSVLWFSGCTVKAVGDPNRPITIKAHVVVDIRNLKETAANIEDYVAGETDELKTKSSESEGAKS